jgi:hypothetical protein
MPRSGIYSTFCAVSARFSLRRRAARRLTPAQRCTQAMTGVTFPVARRSRMVLRSSLFDFARNGTSFWLTNRDNTSAPIKPARRPVNRAVSGASTMMSLPLGLTPACRPTTDGSQHRQKTSRNVGPDAVDQARQQPAPRALRTSASRHPIGPVGGAAARVSWTGRRSGRNKFFGLLVIWSNDAVYRIPLPLLICLAFHKRPCANASCLVAIHRP